MKKSERDTVRGEGERRAPKNGQREIVSGRKRREETTHHSSSIIKKHLCMYNLSVKTMFYNFLHRMKLWFQRLWVKLSCVCLTSCSPSYLIFTSNGIAIAQTSKPFRKELTRKGHSIMILHLLHFISFHSSSPRGKLFCSIHSFIHTRGHDMIPLAVLISSLSRGIVRVPPASCPTYSRGARRSSRRVFKSRISTQKEMPKMKRKTTLIPATCLSAGPMMCMQLEFASLRDLMV